MSEKPEIYIALKNSLFKLLFDYGGQVRRITKDQKAIWTEALALRSKNHTKIIRESKTLSPALDKFLESLYTLKKIEFNVNGNNHELL